VIVQFSFKFFNRARVLNFHAQVVISFYSLIKNAPIVQTHICQNLQSTHAMNRQTTARGRHSVRQSSSSNVVTATTIIHATGAGTTEAAGTRLAFHLILIKGFKVNSFQFQNIIKVSCIVLFVTTSPYWHWVIYAPAAFLR
jgi:hypothetical protein